MDKKSPTHIFENLTGIFLGILIVATNPNSSHLGSEKQKAQLDHLNRSQDENV